MFTSEMQYTPVAKLSGGEKRRLGLMLVLIQNPNFLILDEPTNDLDLITLNKLEEFLLNFGGCLILVSHDRFFMDKLVEHYFVFEGDGDILDHHGTYVEYREQLKERRKQEQREKNAAKPDPEEKKKNRSAGRTSEDKSLNYKERKEYSKLEQKIASLEAEKEKLEAELSNGNLEHEELREKSSRYGDLMEEIEQRTTRWFELAERA